MTETKTEIGTTKMTDFTPEYWNRIWRNAQNASRTSGRGRECWENWDDIESAREYWENMKKRGVQDRVDDLLPLVDGTTRVLDIGAGPGNLSIPLAGKALSVTAVEPAGGMASVLEENMKAEKRDNIRIVRKRWDDIDIETDLDDEYGLTVASYSFGMLDLLDAIRKITLITRGYVVFYWHAGPQVWDTEAAVLWPLLHGREFHQIPKADIIFNMLYSMGIYADVKAIPRSYRAGFDTMQDAVNQYCQRFDVKEDDNVRIQLLREHLGKSLIEKDGRLYQKDVNTGMRISWCNKK